MVVRHKYKNHVSGGITEASLTDMLLDCRLKGYGYTQTVQRDRLQKANVPHYDFIPTEQHSA